MCHFGPSQTNGEPAVRVCRSGGSKPPTYPIIRQVSSAAISRRGFAPSKCKRTANTGVRQAKLAKDKEMQVLYRVRFNQPLWPRVMRESVREDGREAFTGETMGWVLSGESGQSSRCRSRSAEEKATSFHAQKASVKWTLRRRRPHARGDVL